MSKQKAPKKEVTIQPTLKPVNDNAKRSSALTSRQKSTNESPSTRHSDVTAAAQVTRSAGSKSGHTAEALVPQQPQSSTRGSHSGRPLPPTTPAGGENDYAETASNGGVTGVSGAPVGTAMQAQAAANAEKDSE